MTVIKVIINGSSIKNAIAMQLLKLSVHFRISLAF